MRRPIDSTTRLAAVSVDLDELYHYYQLHGLDAPSDGALHLVYDRALSRLLDWSAELGIPLTLFAVGRDLEREQSRAALSSLLVAGHEIANHSLDHRYDLTRLSPTEMRRQVLEGNVAIERALGVRPVGFRAPGYVVSDALFEVLEDGGFEYDSSVFPCAPYYLAKLAALTKIRLSGRQSVSLLDTPRVLRAPRQPYRVGVPYTLRGNGLLELPIQTTRRLRLPFIGTTLTLAGPRAARRLTRGVVGDAFVNLELHGVDALGSEDELGTLAAHQVDLRVSVQRKLAALSQSVITLRRAGYEFVRLRDAVKRFH